MKDNNTDGDSGTNSRKLLDDFRCYIFSFTEQKVIQQINRYALNSLGYTKDELIGKKKFEALLTPGSKILFLSQILPLLNLKGNAEELVLILKTKKLEEIPLLLNLSVTVENSIKVYHVAGLPMAKRNEYEKRLLETIKNSAKIFSENEALVALGEKLETNQLILEKKLRETNRLNDEHNQFNKLLAHDLQEPLRKIHYYADALQQTVQKPRRELTKIIEAASKMRMITKNLERFYTLDYKLNNILSVDLVEVILQAKAQSAASESDCNLIKSTDIKFKSNPAHLKGLFKELFDNAYKFRQLSKPLHITIESQIVQQNIYKATDGKYLYKDFLRIKFADNGSGFSNQYAPKVFQIFQKLHPNHGLGIGMSYCKKIVELYNGTITVTSEINSGTTFTISLPYLS